MKSLQNRVRKSEIFWDQPRTHGIENHDRLLTTQKPHRALLSQKPTQVEPVAATMSDAAIEAFYANIYADLSVDREEAAELTAFLTKLNPPPDKLTKLRSTAFKAAVGHLSNDKDKNTQLLRTINFVVHAIEQTCMMAKAEPGNAVDFNEEALTTFLEGIFDGDAVDVDENKDLFAYFTETNPPKAEDLVATRAHIFKVASDNYLSDDSTEANTQLLRNVNAIVHAYELSCYLPKPYKLQDESTVNVSSMDLNGAAQYLWNLDVNRLTPRDDYDINVQHGKKPFQKEDSATDPLFTRVDAAVWKRPTYQAFYQLLDNYISHTGQAETVSAAEKKEVQEFIAAIMETAPMQFCHKYCHAKKPSEVPASRADFVQLLQKVWFELYRRDGSLDSSGFEHVFIGEVKNGEVSGFHNWINFYLEEKKGDIDYRGYIKPRGNNEAQHGDDDYLLTLQFAWKGVEKFVGTSFIGVSPEFEMALYTMCFLVGEEENKVNLDTGSDVFGLTIKCYTIAGGKIGTTFPEVASHHED
jgi:poly(U)-specific endoribonuclease